MRNCNGYRNLFQCVRNLPFPSVLAEGFTRRGVAAPRTLCACAALVTCIRLNREQNSGSCGRLSRRTDFLPQQKLGQEGVSATDADRTWHDMNVHRRRAANGTPTTLPSCMLQSGEAPFCSVYIFFSIKWNKYTGFKVPFGFLPYVLKRPKGVFTSDLLQITHKSKL
jgi:hypothetical protein